MNIHFGISRRKSGEVIKKGQVKVNDKTILEPWYILKKGDKVEFTGKVVEFRGDELKKVYYLFHKPKGVISAMKDHRGRKTISDLIKGKIKERVFHVGRLDFNTSGLMILTNDGDFANLMMHPRYKVNKEYEVLVKGKVKAEDIEIIKKGVNIGDYITQPAKIKKVKYLNGKTKILLIIKEGKKRQVRRMFRSLGYEVLELKRLQIAFWKLKEVPNPGDIKRIKKEEIEKLKRMLMYEERKK